MSEIRFLLDENVNPILRTALLRRNSDLTVWQIGMLGTPKLGTPDPEILVWCEENQFILVTNNRRSMPRHLTDHLAAGSRASGILTLSEAMSIREIIEELLLIASISSAEDYLDQIIHLPIT